VERRQAGVLLGIWHSQSVEEEQNKDAPESQVGIGTMRAMRLRAGRKPYQTPDGRVPGPGRKQTEKGLVRRKHHIGRYT